MDVIIFGGGIAGLWLLNRLCNAGYDAILLEAGRLGQGQTIASQGMIHGGVKYTLGGNLTGASQSIAEMPDHWKACIEGKGDVDLRGTDLLSTRYFMWPQPGLRSRLTAFLGSKALRGKVTTLDQQDYPDFFKGHVSGPVYQLTDIVLDLPSLLTTLSERYRDRIFQLPAGAVEATVNSQGGLESLTVRREQQVFSLSANRYVLASGEGTEDLLDKLGLEPVAMQRRPLQMVMVRHRHPHPIYVHCVADNLTATPALTVTAHPAGDGEWVWYLGGELAETGVNLPAAQQIERARDKLEQLFPWCDFSGAHWDTLMINRAEPRQQDGSRPDSAFVKAIDNVRVCWPTKLTLAPALANRLMMEFGEEKFTPGMHTRSHPPLPFPGIASTPWSEL